ncbi:hypothetical protein K4F52_004719 [Lecanicillium sp. MT-2017a]|nr:hypothetical protein K4F52_004719 [Lecanicillium sp. MT-2017a]
METAVLTGAAGTRKNLHAWLLGRRAPNGLCENAAQERLDRTRNWILRRLSFLDWASPDFQAGSARLLWINGPAGCGKTTLCARVVEYLASTPDLPAAHFFFSSDFESCRDPFMALRSWISQLLSHPAAFEAVREKRDARHSSMATRTDIVSIFQEVVQVIPNCTFVMDGLDECTGIGDDWNVDYTSSVTNFLETIQQVVSGTSTRIMVSSRDKPEIRRGIVQHTGVTIFECSITPDDVEPDTEQYSRSIAHKRLFNKDEPVKDEISWKLSNRSDVTIGDNFGRAPLNVTSGNGQVEVVKLLLEKGADPAVVDTNEWTPLNTASCFGHVKVVRRLTDCVNREQSLLSNTGYSKETPHASVSPRPLNRSGYPLHRFYKRTIVLILAPLAVTVYYFWIWRALLSRDAEGLKYSNQDEAWIFYSWFVIGVFGLGLSKYGLEGVEASMLHEPLWQVDNAMVLLMHSGSTWSGPLGWVKCLRMLLRNKMGPQRLWFALAFPSALAYAAMPLSGLTMELSDGYVKARGHPSVAGRTWRNFDNRGPYVAAARGATQWLSGLDLTVPGIGIAYTPPYLDRDQKRFLRDLPNSFPDGKESNQDGIAELFLAPQAPVPVAGKAWGLLLELNCSIVETESEFTIVDKIASSQYESVRYIPIPFQQFVTEDQNLVYTFNGSVDESQANLKSNLWGYAQVGVTDPYDRRDEDKISYHNSEFSPAKERGPKPDVLEYALWQVRLGSIEDDVAMDQGFAFNDTIDMPVAGLGQLFIEEGNGTFSVNQSLFAPYPLPPPLDWDFADPEKLNISGNASTHSLSAPIGVRCLRKSALGTADIDGDTFTSFSETSLPDSNPLGGEPTPRFGYTAYQILIGQYVELLRATNAPPPLRDQSQLVELYPGFVQARTLLQSVLRAHAVDALHLMYDGVNSLDDAHVDTNLTSSEAGKIIEPGAVSPVLVAVLYVTWATACISLGCIYGFRKRWAEYLDGYSFFRFGADFSDEVHGQPGFSSVGPLDRCETLQTLPGMVGDAGKKLDIGHITLTRRGNRARKDKLYN